MPISHSIKAEDLPAPCCIARRRGRRRRRSANSIALLRNIERLKLMSRRMRRFTAFPDRTPSLARQSAAQASKQGGGAALVVELRRYLSVTIAKLGMAGLVPAMLAWTDETIQPSVTSTTATGLFNGPLSQSSCQRSDRRPDRAQSDRRRRQRRQWRHRLHVHRRRQQPTVQRCRSASWFHEPGSDTYILLNTDGDVAADGVIRVLGVHSVDASWFVL